MLYVTFLLSFAVSFVAKINEVTRRDIVDYGINLLSYDFLIFHFSLSFSHSSCCCCVDVSLETTSTFFFLHSSMYFFYRPTEQATDICTNAWNAFDGRKRRGKEKVQRERVEKICLTTGNFVCFSTENRGKESHVFEGTGKTKNEKSICFLHEKMRDKICFHFICCTTP